MNEGILWKVKNSRACQFWQDYWLEEGCILANKVDQLVWNGMEEANVADMVDTSGNWDSGKLNGLMRHIRVMLEMIKPPNANEEDDKAVWSLTLQGKFSTTIAYKLLIHSFDLNCRLWEKVWGWKGSQRIKLFSWLSANDALLTNKKRTRIMLSDLSLCGRCNTHKETTLHVLQDCIHARSIWEQVIPYVIWNKFFALLLIDFIMASYREEFTIEQGAVMFGVGLWLIWKRQNIAFFKGKTRS